MTLYQIRPCIYGLAGHSLVFVQLITLYQKHIFSQEAEELGNKDRMRLLKSRKLALIVDLDQTLVHTSMDPNIEPGLPVGFEG